MKGISPPQDAGAADLLMHNQQKEEPENRSILNDAVHKVVGTVWHSQSNTRNEIEGYTSQLITAVPLFIGGGRGIAASALLFGLNQAKVGDTTIHQIEDFGLGALKGAGTKLVFDHFGAKSDWNFATKGVAMGASSRGLDVALTRQTWFDHNDTPQPSAGIQSTFFSMFHPAALATDVITFGVAHYGNKLGNVWSKGAIEASPLLQNTLTGTTFGFTSGALGEMQHQMNDPKEGFDPWKILARGGASAVTMSAAAAAGFKLTDPSHLPVVQLKTERFKTLDWLNPSASQIGSPFATNGEGSRSMAIPARSSFDSNSAPLSGKGQRITESQITGDLSSRKNELTATKPPDTEPQNKNRLSASAMFQPEETQVIVFATGDGFGSNCCGDSHLPASVPALDSSLVEGALQAVPAEHIPKLTDAIADVPAPFQQSTLENFLRLNAPARASLTERLQFLPAAEGSVTLEWLSRMPDATEFLTAVSGVTEQYRAHAFQTMWLPEGFRQVLTNVPEAARAQVLENFARLSLQQQNMVADLVACGAGRNAGSPVSTSEEVLQWLTSQPGNNPVTAALSSRSISGPVESSALFDRLRSLGSKERTVLTTALSTLGDPLRQAGPLGKLLNINLYDGAPFEIVARAPIDWRLSTLLQSVAPEGVQSADWRAHINQRALDVLLETARQHNWFDQMFGRIRTFDESERCNRPLVESALNVNFRGGINYGLFRAYSATIDLHPNGSLISQIFRHELRHFADDVDLSAMLRVDPAAFRGALMDQVVRDLGGGHPRGSGRQIELSASGRSAMGSFLREVERNDGNFDRVLRNADGTVRQIYRALLEEIAASTPDPLSPVDMLRAELHLEYRLYKEALRDSLLGVSPDIKPEQHRALEQLIDNRETHFRTVMLRRGTLADSAEFQQHMRGLVDSTLGRAPGHRQTYFFASPEEFAARRSQYSQAQRNIVEHLRSVGLTGESLRDTAALQGRFITELTGQQNALARMYRDFPPNDRRVFEQALAISVIEPTSMVDVVALPATARTELTQFLRAQLARGIPNHLHTRAVHELVVQELARLSELQRAGVS